MQIHRFFVASKPVNAVRDGVRLTFCENVGLISEGDAIVVRLDCGREELLLVTSARSDGWTADCAAPGEIAQKSTLKLIRFDENRIEVRCD
jgi:hypothetical protein